MNPAMATQHNCEIGEVLNRLGILEAREAAVLKAAEDARVAKEIKKDELAATTFFLKVFYFAPTLQ